MEEIRFDSIQQVNDYYGITTFHPLVTVVHLERSNYTATAKSQVHYGVYAIWLKETKGCNLSYGRTPYDFDEQTVTSFEPGQTVTVEMTDRSVRPKCVGLLFHPDFLNPTNLGRNIRRYEFFSYSSTEALHLSESEVVVFKQVLDMIESELKHPIDNHTRELIVSNIELLLNYCLRFYDRQFIIRHKENSDILSAFERNIKDYFEQGSAVRGGLPSVAYFADKACLSPGYFGDLIRKETGMTAQYYIQQHILALSKQLLLDPSQSISQIYDRLGFQYPQHFSRFFKKLAGMTPKEYREK